MRREREGKEENDEAGAQAEAGADAHVADRNYRYSAGSIGSVSRI